MVVIRSPLRVSLLGGGTDFEDFYSSYGGAVLSTTINKSVFTIVQERFDDRVCVNSPKQEIVDRFDKLEHDLVREAMRLTGVTEGVDISTFADLPAEGSGLGSSSSTTVGLLQALYTYRGEDKLPETLAREACHIEIDVLGRPIGKQDQYIAAYGSMRFITFSKNGVQTEKVELPPENKQRLNDSLLLFYTGIIRKAGDILREQKANINQRVEELLEMKKLAYKARQAISNGALDEFGELLHQGWKLKKGFASKITNSEIDSIYEVARKAGVTGGKISGAGGGGFLLLYCPKEKQAEVRTALRRYREFPFRFEEDGSRVIFNSGRSQ